MQHRNAPHADEGMWGIVELESTEMNDSKQAEEVHQIEFRLGEAMRGTPSGVSILATMADEVHEMLSEDRDRRETWAGLLEWMDRRWPEDLFPTLTDSPGRDTGPRLTSALRRLAAVEKLATEMASKASAEDWGDDVMSTAHADAGRAFLRVIGVPA